MKFNLALVFVAAQAASVLATRGPHPLGNAGGKLDQSRVQACEKESPYGCTDGYCWKRCDDSGAWCWTALEGGNGPWTPCQDFNDCDGSDGSDCAMGDCADCGCSC